MGKGKPRCNPDKPSNQYGGDGCCWHADEVNGQMHCMYGIPQHVCEQTCRYNLHNCNKTVYRAWAGKTPTDGKPSVKHF